MLVVGLAFRNLFRHPTRTFFMAALVFLGTVLISVSVALLEGATLGLSSSVIGSLTGHMALGAPSEEAYGLFGSEVPIVGEYEGIPPLRDSPLLISYLQQHRDVASAAPIVSALANLKLDKYSQKSVLFGIDPATYFLSLPDLEIVWGDAEELYRGGIFINEIMARSMEQRLKRPLVSGEPITAAVAAGGTFRLRTFYIAGVFRYKAPLEILDRIALADPALVRSLVNYTLGTIQGTSAAAWGSTGAEKDNSSLVTTQGDLDALFAVTQDTNLETAQGLSLNDVESTLADTAERDRFVAADSGAWSFILIRLHDQGALSRVKKELVQYIAQQGIEARILSWYIAAGSTAVMLIVLKTAFAVGIVFLVIGAFMILANAQVISILERTGEIGTIRALGTQKDMVVALISLEILLVTLSAALGGLFVGALITWGINRGSIGLANPLLMGLFGGKTLQARLTPAFVILYILGMVGASLLAALYPIRLALSVSPREAIHDAE